jgi:hypothetical protein
MRLQIKLEIDQQTPSDLAGMDSKDRGFTLLSQFINQIYNAV